MTPFAMAEETLWSAPAKLNLFLHVTGRRPDGYHTLQTAYQLLDLCDTVGITVCSNGRIERTTGHPDVAAKDDLAVRAARALQGRTRTTLGAVLRVHKRIPLGGGLGGGSSDAATVLVALNHLWRVGLSRSELAAIGLELGADVPVFVHGTCAWAEGIGEQLTPIELAGSWFVIIHPGVAVPTVEVFAAPELRRDSPPLSLNAFAVSGILPEASWRNDCEPVVRARFPQVAEALAWLARFAPARLTGTGSCVFARCRSAAEAERIAARVPDAWRSFVACGINRSPLEAELERPLG